MAKKSIYYTDAGFRRDTSSNRRGSYYASHYKNIKKSRAISFSKLQNGFLGKMDYFGNTTQRLKTAIYLVIEPDYTPPRFAAGKLTSKQKADTIIETYSRGGNKITDRQKRYMHVFDLSYVPPAQVRKLVDFTKEVRISNFIFSRSNFAFLDFVYKKRALYDALIPVMRDSYRTLIRDKINIKNVSIIDYDFKDKTGIPNIVFIKPNLNNPQLKLQLQLVASELEIDNKKLLNSLRSGFMTKLDISRWATLKRTMSSMDQGAEWFYGYAPDLVSGEYKISKEVVVKEIEKMMPQIFKDARKYAPVVLNYEGELHLVYGEKLMQVCRALAITPTVYMIKV